MPNKTTCQECGRSVSGHKGHALDCSGGMSQTNTPRTYTQAELDTAILDARRQQREVDATIAENHQPSAEFGKEHYCREPNEVRCEYVIADAIRGEVK